MKYLVLFISFFLTVFTLKAQIENGNWLVGGDLNFSHRSNMVKPLSMGLETRTNITLNSEAGYFFFNKFVAGIITSLEYGNVPSLHGWVLDFGGGPFIRYYFLNPEKMWNLLTEINYVHTIRYANGRYNSRSERYSILGGPVIFLNTSIGLSITFGYSQTHVPGNSGRIYTITSGIGFQYYFQ